MRYLLVTTIMSMLGAWVCAGSTNTAITSAVAPTLVFTASTPDAVMLPEKAMRESQRLSRSRTRDSYPGASHEASVVVDAGRSEPRAEEPRGKPAPTNQPVSVSGAKMARDVAGPVTAPLTPAQREAQRATETRNDTPVKAGE